MTRDTLINFKASRAERDAFQAAADRCGLSLSAWLREVALAAAGKSELLRDLRRAERAGKRR